MARASNSLIRRLLPAILVSSGLVLGAAMIVLSNYSSERDELAGYRSKLGSVDANVSSSIVNTRYYLEEPAQIKLDDQLTDEARRSNLSSRSRLQPIYPVQFFPPIPVRNATETIDPEDPEHPEDLQKFPVLPAPEVVEVQLDKDRLANFIFWSLPVVEDAEKECLPDDLAYLVYRRDASEGARSSRPELLTLKPLTERSYIDYDTPLGKSLEYIVYAVSKEKGVRIPPVSLKVSDESIDASKPGYSSPSIPMELPEIEWWATRRPIQDRRTGGWPVDLTLRRWFNIVSRGETHRFRATVFAKAIQQDREAGDFYFVQDLLKEGSEAAIFEVWRDGGWKDYSETLASVDRLLMASLDMRLNMRWMVYLENERSLVFLQNGERVKYNYDQHRDAPVVPPEPQSKLSIEPDGASSGRQEGSNDASPAASDTEEKE